MKRAVLILSLLTAAIGLQAWRGGARGAMYDDLSDSVPEAVLTAADQGRFWHATRLLDTHLAAVGDTSPATLLLAARLNAGWEEWEVVASLLEGRDWLDTVERGEGWALVGRARMARGESEAGAEALTRYLEVARPGGEDRGRIQLRRGLALAEAGEAAAALDAFDDAAARLPWFADWAHYFAAAAMARVGEPAEVNRRLALAGTTGPAHWRLRVGAALVAGDTMRAREAALSATRQGARTDRAEAWAELGRLRIAAGDSARGRAALLRAMDARGSMGAVDAARWLSELELGPEEWRAVANVYRWHGNAARAAEGYEAYLEAGIGTAADRAGVRLELGRARFDAGRYRQAEQTLLTLAADSVPARIAAEALYTAARAQYRQGRARDGQATFLRLAERYPEQEAVTRGLYLAADLKHDDLELDGPEGARVFYRRAAEARPDLNEAGLALMRLAGLAYLEAEYREAAAIWEEYRTLHPEGRRIAQATYWAARSYARLGQDSLAGARLHQVRQVDPLSFYGMRAAELLGEPILAIPMADAPEREPALEDAFAPGLRRVDLLAELGRRDALVEEVERLRRTVQAEDGPDARAREYALAEALNERGYTLTGIGMGWTIWEETGRWNPRLLRLVYPLPYRSLVLPEAEDRGLDPYLVAGLIRRESAFNPLVVSGAGAMGLMQIVPETGRQLARGEALPFHSDLLFQPEINLHLGTRFLAQLLERYDESLPLALAAYNAGPTRANRWRDLPEIDDPELFMERVPYGETRDYIRHVLVHRSIYRALYPGLDEAGAGTSP